MVTTFLLIYLWFNVESRDVVADAVHLDQLGVSSAAPEGLLVPNYGRVQGYQARTSH